MQRGAEAAGNRDPDRKIRRHHHAGNHAGKAKYRADRQVDAAGNDHRRHAERDDADEGAIARHVEEVVAGEEGVAGERQIDEGQNGGDEHPECLSRKKLAEGPISLVLNGLVESDGDPVGIWLNGFGHCVFSGCLDGASDETRNFFGR